MLMTSPSLPQAQNYMKVEAPLDQDLHDLNVWIVGRRLVLFFSEIECHHLQYKEQEIQLSAKHQNQ